MKNIELLYQDKGKTIPIIWNIISIAVVYMIPDLVKWFGSTIYFIEPIRLLIIIGLIHTGAKNGYFLALMLPLSAFIFTGHPPPAKMMLIVIEMSLNILIFISAGRSFGNYFLAMLSGVIFSKWFYFVGEYIVLNYIFPGKSFGTHPILWQLSIILFLSLYAHVWLKIINKEETKEPNNE